MTLIRPYSASFYVGDNVTKTFSFVFDEVAEEFVKVMVSHADGTVSIPTYTVDMDLKQVVFGDDTPAPSDDDIVCVYRATPVIQDTPFRTLQGYNAQALENILSKIVAMIQEVKATYFSTQILQGAAWQLDLLKSEDDGATVNIDYVAKKLVKGLYFRINNGNLQVSADGSSYITMPKSSDIVEFRQVQTVLPDLTVQYRLQYRIGNEWFNAESNAEATADEALRIAEEARDTADDAKDIAQDAKDIVDTVDGRVTQAEQDSSDAKNTVDAHVLDTNNPHSVTASQVGLGNVDNTADIDKPISTATQGALDDLQDEIDALKGLGRFLSVWNCATGLAETNPPESPYTYNTGDYFLVGTVSSATPAVNYRPNGATYTTGVPSTTVETAEVKVNDVYIYDGTNWKLQANSQRQYTFSGIAGSPYDNTNLSTALNAKQDTISDLAEIRSGAALGTTAVQPGDLATVATSGSYNDLSDTPTIPSINNRVNGAPLSNSASVFYGVSTSAKTVVDKIVSIPSITTLDVGTAILVKPTVTSTVANSGIKLNDFPAYPMRYIGSAITTSTDSIVWSANTPSLWIFDGEYWVFAGHGVDTNTTYSAMSVAEGIAGTATSSRTMTAAYTKQIIQGTTLTDIDVATTGAVTDADSITSGIGKLQATKADKSEIPTVNNPTITITQGGVTKGSFTLNQATGDTIALDAGGGVGNIDNLTITTNADSEIQAVATVNANSAAGATNPVYDWVGTLAEYTSQAVATNHPEWICYITDDTTAQAYEAYSKSQTDTLLAGKVSTGHEVIEFQAPTAANNYTWYRKYADGWVEQGGYIDGNYSHTFSGTYMSGYTATTITLPVEMDNTNVNIYCNSTVGQVVASGNLSSSTTLEIKLSSVNFTASGVDVSWQVSGMAA